MENLTADSRKIMSLNVRDGVLITEVFANSTAAVAGFRKGDILLSVNAQPMTSAAGANLYMQQQTTGQSFTYEIYTDKKIQKGKAVFQPYPNEQHAGLDMIYTDAITPAGRQRIIISKPSSVSSRLPAIVFIGGIGCYSLDFPFDSTQSEVQLLNYLSRSGFLCARAEKPGMGDNIKTKRCHDISFTEETSGYTSIINTLKRRPDVDSNAIYIFGHSMGGVFAPLIAQQTKIKGIIAYGTIGSNFLEYLMKSRKTVAEASKMSPVETDKFIKDCCECSVYYFADKMTTEQAENKKPGCRDLVSVFDLRSRAYNDELYAFNIPSLWQTYKGKTLLLWGSADFVSVEDDHKLIQTYTANVDLTIVNNADHGMLTAKDFVESLNNPGKYNPEVGKITLAWLKRN